MSARELSYAQAVNEALRQEMRRDPAVIIMGEETLLVALDEPIRVSSMPGVAPLPQPRV
jgi:pyruvate/2-oxoglutarate/acetoin dehydrogenase E1 component